MKKIIIFGIMLLLLIGVASAGNNTKNFPIEDKNKTEHDLYKDKISKFKDKVTLNKNTAENKYGKIIFDKQLNINEDKFIFIDKYKVFVDDKNDSRLNTNAEIIFYDVNLKNPVILKNGYKINIPFTYKDNILKFNVTGFSEYDLSEDIVSYWKFDGDATDSVGSNNLTNDGATYGAGYGKINGGYSFSTDDSMYLNSFTIGDSTDPFTFNIWLYATAYSQEAISYTPDNSNNYQIQIYNGATYFQRGAQYVTGVGLSLNTWYMLTMTYDGTNIKGYIDGTQTGSTISSTTSYSGATDHLRIGRHAISGVRYWNGYLDEVGIWSRALTATEVGQLYNSGSGLQYPFSEEDNIVLNIDTINATVFQQNGSISITGNTTGTVTSLTINKTGFSNSGNLTDFNFVKSPLHKAGNMYLYINASNSTTSDAKTIYITINNTAPSSPSDISFNLAAYDFEDSVIVNGSGSSDYESLTYYYKFNISDIVQDFSTNNTFVLNSSMVNNTLYVYTKSFDGILYSSVYNESVYIYDIDETPSIDSDIEYLNNSLIIDFGVCPDNNLSNRNLWLTVAIMVIFAILGMIFKNQLMTVFSGAAMIFASLIVMQCGVFIGYIFIVYGIITVITGLVMKS